MSIFETGLQTAFRSAPIPGKFLDPILRAFRVTTSGIATPALVKSRWGDATFCIDDIADVIQRHIYFQGYFEYWESVYIRRALQEGGTFVDVGANIGWYTLLAAARVGPRGRVFAFEPSPATYSKLVRNVSVNDFDHICTQNVGLGEDDCDMSLFALDAGNSGANTLHASPGARVVDTVAIRRAENLLQSLDVREIDFCKIDVEGAELSVLHGLGEYIRDGHIRQLMIEINGESLTRAGTQPGELIEFLRSSGYHLNDIRSGREIRDVDTWRGALNVICQR